MNNTNIALGLMLVVAVSATTWGFFEHRRNGVFAETVAMAEKREAELRRQIDLQQQQLRATAAELNETLRKKMPVEVVFVPATGGKGRMVVFKNNAPEPMDVGVVIFNPATAVQRPARFRIQALGTQSISESQGWTLAAGQHIQLTHADYGTVDYPVP